VHGIVQMLYYLFVIIIFSWIKNPRMAEGRFLGTGRTIGKTPMLRSDPSLLMPRNPIHRQSRHSMGISPHLMTAYIGRAPRPDSNRGSL
jgi:hypothetical protein